MRGTFDQDSAGREIIVHTASASDVLAVADTCKWLQSNGLTGDKEMQHLAEFPGYLIQQYCDQKGIGWDEWFQNPVHARAMLNDPDLRDFRIKRSRV